MPNEKFGKYQMFKQLLATQITQFSSTTAIVQSGNLTMCFTSRVRNESVIRGSLTLAHLIT